MSKRENLQFNAAAIAQEVHSLWRTGRQVDLFTRRYSNLELPEAYEAAFALRRLRERKGEHVIGRKLSFTNRLLWEKYNVQAPGWGYIYDTTCFELSSEGRTSFSLDGIQEPRIEPEIMLGFSSAPEPGMSDDQLLGCIGWVAHGFELVHSIFADWRFTGPDTIIGHALHAAVFLGPRHPIESGWQQVLESFRVNLLRNGVRVAEGSGANVLGSPFLAVRDLVNNLGVDEARPPLQAGEFVSTGTLTDAMPAFAGETWETVLSGLALPGAKLTFT